MRTEENAWVETYEVGNLRTVTVVIEHYQGYVGESVHMHEIYITDYKYKKPRTKLVETVEEFKKLYKTFVGKKVRIELWYYVKNFGCWWEDPYPYIV